MTLNKDPLSWLCVNTIRTLSIDAIQNSNSGHPGLPMGAAPMAFVLFQNHLKHNPANPKWEDRDRFVLSAGHGSMLLYSLLHLTGYDLSLDEIKCFRKLNSRTPGHPEFGLTPGVDATTGPLGQGSANAVGMAIAERKLAALNNKTGAEVVNHFTYALVSDGDLMEGVSAEAASLAGHLKLGKLIYLYDANDITLDGPTSLSFSTENVKQRYESYGWHVQLIIDGNHDLDGIDRAITLAKAETEKPSLIIVKTTIGFGSPNKQGKSSSHGAPLGADEILATKKNLSWDFTEPFTIPQEALSHFRKALEKGKAVELLWNQSVQKMKSLSLDFGDWSQGLPEFKSGEKIATRVASGKIINAIALRNSTFFGGDADLSCSTMTLIQEGGDFDGQTGTGKNVHYGVREHAMAAIANGIAYHAGLQHFVSTFFTFADYMRPAIRLAALNHLPVIYVFTHDSVGVGEDGPTHQPVEHLASLRCIPGLTVIRPADANETRQAWIYALKNIKGPTAIILSRQNLTVFPLMTQNSLMGVDAGGYIVEDSPNPAVVLLATGSEVNLAQSVRKELEENSIPTRLVSFPSWEIFRKRPQLERNKVLGPRESLRVSIEAGVEMGWSEWTGTHSLHISIERFGLSGPGDDVFKALGFNSAVITKKIQNTLASSID